MAVNITNATFSNTTLSPVNSITRPECLSGDGFAQLPRHKLIYFTCANVLLSVVVTLVNCGTIYIMKKTRILAIQSNQLTLLMYVMDIGDAVVGCAAGLVALWLDKKLGCIPKIMLNFLLDFFLNSSTYCIMLVSIDRYIHIKYPNHYSSIFTRRRFKMGVALVLFFTILQTAGASAVTLKFSVQSGKIMMKVCSFIVLCINCLIYIYSRAILKAFEKGGSKLSTDAQSITRIATLYLALTVVFKLIPLLIPIMNVFALNGIISRETMVSVNMYIATILTSYGMLNTFIFLFVNRTAKRYLLQNFFCCGRGVHQRSIELDGRVGGMTMSGRTRRAASHHQH